MINLVCHDLNLSEDSHYENTMSWIKICQRNAPSSEIRILLTKIDKVDHGKREAKRQRFVDRFICLIEKEISLTSKHKKKCSESNKLLYDKHLSNFKQLKEQIKPADGSQSKVLELSCKHGHEASVNAVISYLMEFSNRPVHKELMLRPIDRELFVKIGRLGIRQHMIENSQSMYGDKLEEDKEEKKTEKPNEKREGSCDMHQQSTIKEIEHPKLAMKQQFLYFSEVMTKFRQLYRQHQTEITENALQKECRKSLANLKKKGLLRYFIEDREFKDDDIIFHDLSTLVNVLRCVFHHDLSKLLAFDPDNDIYTEFYEKKSMFDEHKMALEEKGILDITLLQFLLHTGSCLVKAEAVSQMLASVNVGIIINTDTDERRKIFIPYFLEQKASPKDIEFQKQAMSRCHRNILSLETTLKYHIPLSFFNELRVKICAKEPRLLRYPGLIKVWGKGMSVDLDEKKGKLLMYHNQDTSVTLLLQAEVTKAEGHQLLFEHVAFIDSETGQIRQSEYPGLPLDYVLTCTHCVIEPEDCKDPVSFEVAKLLNPEDQPKEAILCGSQSNIPHGLITPLPKGEGLVTNGIYLALHNFHRWGHIRLNHVLIHVKF